MCECQVITTHALDAGSHTRAHATQQTIAYCALHKAAPDLARLLGWTSVQLEAVDETIGDILDAEASLPDWVKENLRTRMVCSRGDAARARISLESAGIKKGE